MRSSSGFGALALAVLIAVGATPWGRERVEGVRSFAEFILYFTENFGIERTLAAFRGERVRQDVDLSARTPDQIIAGMFAPHDLIRGASLYGPHGVLSWDADRRMDELVRRGETSLPALTELLASKDPERVRFALTALRRGGHPVPDAVPILDRLLSDRGVGDDAAKVLWNSGSKGRAVIEKAAFYEPPPPPSSRAIDGILESHRNRKESAMTPFYHDPDSGFEILRRALQSDSHEARHLAADQMGSLKIRRVEAVALLIAALEKEEYATQRPSIIGALERLGPDAAAAIPVLRRLAGSRDDEEDAVVALFELTGSDGDMERLVSMTENKRGRRFNLNSLAKACPRSPRARALVEKAYLAPENRSKMGDSYWRTALRNCLGESLTPAKQAAFDALHEKGIKERLEKSKKG